MPGTRIFAMSQDSVKELQQGEIIQADSYTEEDEKVLISPAGPERSPECWAADDILISAH